MQASLSLLRTFESAGRTGSFRSAALELNLSPSAVSHAIRSLEQSLGVVLFERDGRTVRLSGEGEALMRHVGRAFEDLRRGMEIVSTRGPRLLRVHSAPSTDYTRFTSDEFDVDIVGGEPGRHTLGRGNGDAALLARTRTKDPAAR